MTSRSGGGDGDARGQHRARIGARTRRGGARPDSRLAPGVTSRPVPAPRARENAALGAAALGAPRLRLQQGRQEGTDPRGGGGDPGGLDPVGAGPGLSRRDRPGGGGEWGGDTPCEPPPPTLGTPPGAAALGAPLIAPLRFSRGGSPCVRPPCPPPPRSCLSFPPRSVVLGEGAVKKEGGVTSVLISPPGDTPSCSRSGIWGGYAELGGHGNGGVALGVGDRRQGHPCGGDGNPGSGG